MFCNSLYIYSDEQVLDVVEKITKLLDEQIDSSKANYVREYISKLSAYRGLLVSIEFQLKRNLTDKEYEALDSGIMNAKSVELREIQLNEHTKNERENFEIIKRLREELTNKSTLASSVLKSIDINKQ
jgi:hypothetical protein